MLHTPHTRPHGGSWARHVGRLSRNLPSPQLGLDLGFQKCAMNCVRSAWVSQSVRQAVRPEKS